MTLLLGCCGQRVVYTRVLAVRRSCCIRVRCSARCQAVLWILCLTSPTSLTQSTDALHDSRRVLLHACVCVLACFPVVWFPCAALLVSLGVTSNLHFRRKTHQAAFSKHSKHSKQRALGLVTAHWPGLSFFCHHATYQPSPSRTTTQQPHQTIPSHVAIAALITLEVAVAA